MITRFRALSSKAQWITAGIAAFVVLAIIGAAMPGSKKAPVSSGQNVSRPEPASKPIDTIIPGIPDSKLTAACRRSLGWPTGGCHQRSPPTVRSQEAAQQAAVVKQQAADNASTQTDLRSYCAATYGGSVAECAKIIAACGSDEACKVAKYLTHAAGVISSTCVQRTTTDFRCLVHAKDGSKRAEDVVLDPSTGRFVYAPVR